MDLKTRLENLLSDILTDKYGDEYGVKITIHLGSNEKAAGRDQAGGGAASPQNRPHRCPSEKKAPAVAG